MNRRPDVWVEPPSDDDSVQRVAFVYDAATVDLIKTTIPVRARRYVPALHCWEIRDPDALDAFLAAARERGHHIRTLGDESDDDDALVLRDRAHLAGSDETVESERAS